MFWYGPLLNDISFTDKTLQNSIWLLYHIFRKCDEGISLPESLWKWYTFKEILELLGTYWFLGIHLYEAIFGWNTIL